MDLSQNRIFMLRDAASKNDKDLIKLLMTDENYHHDQGQEAIAIAMSCNHLEIVYELLSFPGSLDKFFNMNQFRVDNGLRDAVQNYITKRDN